MYVLFIKTQCYSDKLKATYRKYKKMIARPHVRVLCQILCEFLKIYLLHCRLENCAHCLRTFMYSKFPGRDSLHCKKRVASFPSPVGMSLTKLSLAGNNVYSFSPGKVWLEKSQESRNFFTV